MQWVHVCVGAPTQELMSAAKELTPIEAHSQGEVIEPY